MSTADTEIARHASCWTQRIQQLNCLTPHFLYFISYPYCRILWAGSASTCKPRHQDEWCSRFLLQTFT